jgi:hypothetical protein
MAPGRVCRPVDFPGITEPEPVIAPFRRRGDARHPHLMALRTIALDLSAVGVLLSLISIILFVAFGVAISLLTVARARRQLRRLTARIGPSPGLFASKDLAEIDEALERIMSEECAALPAASLGEPTRKGGPRVRN